ncbi:unnamed protein product [Arabis nemorensis]|uniref:FBD domain-containing protein n=1 Tax=Arabis nemorensis TaxID=586526 RepID=A0A565BY06_9BRAS|nr:unnamed protein product [Arabis nemorensis]
MNLLMGFDSVSRYLEPAKRGGLVDFSFFVHGKLGEVLVIPLQLSSLVTMSVGLNLLENASYSKLKTIRFDRNYGVLNFPSLVEARLDLMLVTNDGIVRGASLMFEVVSRVKTLTLSSSSLMSNQCFQNLLHMIMGIDTMRFWPSLPILVGCCPILQTLVFKDDIHSCIVDENELFKEDGKFLHNDLSAYTSSTSVIALHFVKSDV